MLGVALLVAAQMLSAKVAAQVQAPAAQSVSEPGDAGGPAARSDDPRAVDGGVTSVRGDATMPRGERDNATEVVVTASRAPESQRLSAALTQVITREQIEQTGARNVAQLLQNMPALHVQETFRGSELWLRGLDPEYTLILIDGERIPGRIGGAFDLSRFGVERVERVEIVRGPSSALYGADAIAGVVNIIARESRKPLEGDVMLGYGSLNTLDATGFAAGRPRETLRLSATGGYHQADAFRVSGGEATAGSARKQWSAGGTLRYDPRPAHRLIAAGDYSRLALDGVEEAAGGAVLDRSQLQEQTSLRLSHRYDPVERVRWENRAAYGLFRDQYLVDQRGATPLDNYEESSEQLLTFSSLVRAHGPSWLTSSAGVDLLSQRLRSPRLEGLGQRQRVGVFAQEDFRVFQRDKQTLRIVPGLRFDLDSQFGYQFSPKLAVRFDPHESLVLRASYGRGFRAPSFQELLLRFENPSVGYVVYGNPELGAERSHGVDVSAEWTPAAWVSLVVALFRNDLRGMITTVTREDSGTGGTVFTYDNLSTAWTMGVESAALFKHGSWFSLQTSYALTYGYDGENDRVLQGRARHRPTAQLRLAHPTWGLSGLLRTSLEIGRRFFVDDDGDGDEDLEKPPPLARVDARIEQRIGKHAELFVGVDNIAEAHDEFAALRPRTYYGGARGRY